MKIEEAIERAEAVAARCGSDTERGKVHLQLIGWLKELLWHRETWDKVRKEIVSYKDDKLIHAEQNEMIDIVLDIIDKYKSESEG